MMNLFIEEKDVTSNKLTVTSDGIVRIKLSLNQTEENKHLIKTGLIEVAKAAINLNHPKTLRGKVSYFESTKTYSIYMYDSMRQSCLLKKDF